MSVTNKEIAVDNDGFAYAFLVVGICVCLTIAYIFGPHDKTVECPKCQTVIEITVDK